MSADQAPTRAHLRMNARIDAAIAAGTVAELRHENMVVNIEVGTKKVRLVNGDGTTTREGKHYYEKLGTPPPSVYPYEQQLVNGKWVIGYDGKKHLVRRMNADGQWQTTSKGADYFKHNKDTYQILFPVRPAYPSINNKKTIDSEHEDQWEIGKVDPAIAYHVGIDPDEKWTVGMIRGPATPGSRLSLLATDQEREAHA